MFLSFLHGAYLSSFHQKFDEMIASPILSLNPYVIYKKIDKYRFIQGFTITSK